MANLKISEFVGVARDVHRARLPAGQFSVDEGSDHYERGTWKVRRGQRRTTLAKTTGAVQTILGFETSGGSFATLLIAAGVATGESGATEQSWETSGGYGTGGEGEGGYGE